MTEPINAMGSAAATPDVSADRLRDALDQAFAAYDRAASSSGEATLDAVVAESNLQIRLAVPALAAAVFAPLAHRNTSPGASPELTICIFDKASTGIVPDVATIIDRRMTTPAEITTWTHADVNLLYRREPMPCLVGFDRQRRRAIIWLDDAADIEHWDRCRALLQILHWWLSHRGWQAMHAAAVQSSKGGVLIGGRGGAGKSTTALACVRVGWRYAGDDLVIIRSTPRPRVENLFTTARLRLDMLSRLPEMRPIVDKFYTIDTIEKASLELHAQYPQASFTGFPIHAIVLPRHGRRADFSVTPATRAEAMLSMTPSTMFVVQTGFAATFRQIAAFVDATPAYWCDVGPDLARIPPAIDAILAQRVSR